MDRLGAMPEPLREEAGPANGHRAHAVHQPPHSHHPPHAHAPGSAGAHSGRSLGEALGPALLQHCDGRLRDLAWFRSSWQRGGAATGFGRWRTDDGAEREVMIKLPVGPDEYRWTTDLAPPPTPGSAGSDHPTPAVFASGTSLAGYDLAWLIMERLEGHTLNQGWCRQSLEDLLMAAARMQACAIRAAPVSGRPNEFDWDRLLHRARDLIRESVLPEAHHWSESVRKVQKVLPFLAKRWAARPIDSWCHGDLHPGNAMWRGKSPDTTRACVLIDLALVHPGHWVEDAVYLERQFWGRPEALFGVHPVSQLARYRRDFGLRTDGDYGALANLRRVLIAACAPVWIDGEGHPKYLHAALETIDRLLPQIAR
ncbi:MAG: aminoglycoside phosphotransferase family protein [Phycisphaerales bacterium]